MRHRAQSRKYLDQGRLRNHYWAGLGICKIENLVSRTCHVNTSQLGVTQCYCATLHINTTAIA
jgi:hypothetical protein